MSNMAPVVLAQHVTKWYGPRRAVSDGSFAIEPGEIVGLLEPNGSGKSTIFRILTGYLAPSSGRVEVAGHDVVTDLLAVRQAISYVPEDAPLYDHMTYFLCRLPCLLETHPAQAHFTPLPVSVVDERPPASTRLVNDEVKPLTVGVIARLPDRLDLSGRQPPRCPRHFHPKIYPKESPGS